jgi:hypothetical protein
MPVMAVIAVVAVVATTDTIPITEVQQQLSPRPAYCEIWSGVAGTSWLGEGPTKAGGG